MMETEWKGHLKDLVKTIQWGMHCNIKVCCYPSFPLLEGIRGKFREDNVVIGVMQSNGADLR